MRSAVFLIFALCAGCSSGSWVDNPGMSYFAEGKSEEKRGQLAEETAPGVCMVAGKSYTGDWKCEDDGTRCKVKCK